MEAINDAQLSKLDPSGERKALFDYRRNPRSVKPGDILRVTFANGDPFSGLCLSIRLRGVDSAFLLRNQLTRVGVEMWVKVFSPEVQGVEIVQRSEKRKRRARLYYMRFVPVPVSPSPYDLIANISPDNPDMIWAVWRTLCPTTSKRSRLLRGSVRRNGDGFLFFSCISIARYVLCYDLFHLWLYCRHSTHTNNSIYISKAIKSASAIWQKKESGQHTSNSPDPSNPKKQ